MVEAQLEILISCCLLLFIYIPPPTVCVLPSLTGAFVCQEADGRSVRPDGGDPDGAGSERAADPGHRGERGLRGPLALPPVHRAALQAAAGRRLSRVSRQSSAGRGGMSGPRHRRQIASTERLLFRTAKQLLSVNRVWR